ncbi:MAG TPA: arginine deiminase family protein, partial [Gemmatimonadaceae bacterium]|nr:arginine deiminase family protein [Gemmatimonadaceae bacterium]
VGAPTTASAKALSLIALTRAVSPDIVNCELTHLLREPIDLTRAVHQHAQYEETLTSLGCTIERLPALPDNADSVFVEDMAVLLPQLAVIARPGAKSRRNEVSSVADALRAYRQLAFIETPGTLDGGDVLVIGSTIYVGDSTRTNREGIRQLAALALREDYEVRSIPVTHCLHLKSAVTQIAEDAVLLNPDWVDASLFAGLRIIEVDPDEPLAANAFRIGASIVYGTGFGRTSRRLECAGIEIHHVEMSELQKAEGAVTCCSILVQM